MPNLLLASSSHYRRALLSRLHLPFIWQTPNIDETPQPDEAPHALVQRLACQKAQALASKYPNHLIIGSDQVAVLDQKILGKPLTLEGAKQQLQSASGQCVQFFTGLVLLNPKTQRLQSACVTFDVQFRSLTEAQIARYLAKEQPYDCAGSFKAEGLGVSLFQRTSGEDSTSLIGLPLIKLVDMLLAEGVEIP